MQQLYYTILKNRGLVKVTGADHRAFLQGLISNDINLLDKQPCVYACLLTPQGKFLHDFFITEMNETIFLDCEGGARAEDLARRLSIYKLRTKVQIECVRENDVYAVLDDGMMGLGEDKNFASSPHPLISSSLWPDPRHPSMGYRSFTKPENAQEKPFEFYDRRRIISAIPDGSRDMMIEKSTLLECNIDRLNGVSWDKGCYMGQELTARMHYRGLVKKRLQTVKINHPLPDAARLSHSLQGEGLTERAADQDLRSICGDIGLAMVKIAP